MRKRRHCLFCKPERVYLVLESDLQWAAGFLEGEGHFKRTKRGLLGVEANQVNPEPIQKLVRLFGGHTCATPGRNGCQGQVRWYAQSDLAYEVMKVLLPLMSKRRQEQIEKALRPTWIERVEQNDGTEVS